MVARTGGLDRNAKRAVIAAAAIFLAGPLYLIARYTIAATANESGVQIANPQTDQLVQLPDGSTLLIKQGSTGRMIADWMKEDSTGNRTFLVGNNNFAPGTASPTADGWQHLAQFGQLLNARPNVKVMLLFSAYHGQPATIELEHQRADRIRTEALRQGVDGERIAVARQGFEPGHNPAADQGLEVVLTNSG